MSSLFQLSVGPTTNITLVVARHEFEVRARYQVLRPAVGTLERFHCFKLADWRNERPGEMVSQHLLRDAFGTALPTGEPERRHRSAFAADQNAVEHGAFQNSCTSPALIERVSIR